MSVTGLAYVALAVSDVAVAANVLESRFGLARREARAPDGSTAPYFGVGDAALALFAPGDPFLGGVDTTGVHHIAIATPDPAGLAERLGMASTGTQAGLDGRDELRLDAAATCGVRTRLTAALDAVPGNSGLIQRIDHVGVASGDNAAATEFFADRLGLAVESTQTDLEVHTATESFTSDRYGVVYHNRPARVVGGLRVRFITVGDCELEFLEPLASEDANAGNAGPGGGPGNTGADKGAIGRYLERYGPGLHHLALKTADIDAALESFAEQGLSLIDTRGRPGSRRARIGFIHPRSLAGVLVHLVERDEL